MLLSLLLLLLLNSARGIPCLRLASRLPFPFPPRTRRGRGTQPSNVPLPSCQYPATQYDHMTAVCRIPFATKFATASLPASHLPSYTTHARRQSRTRTRPRPPFSRPGCSVIDSSFLSRRRATNDFVFSKKENEKRREEKKWRETKHTVHVARGMQCSGLTVRSRTERAIFRSSFKR